MASQNTPNTFDANNMVRGQSHMVSTPGGDCMIILYGFGFIVSGNGETVGSFDTPEEVNDWLALDGMFVYGFEGDPSLQKAQNGTPDPERDNDPAMEMKRWLDAAIASMEDSAETKPVAGDVITLKMGITVKVIPTLDNSLVGRVIEDVSGLYRPNTKIEFELSEVA